MARHQQPADRNYLWGIFSRIDSNRDGGIDANELQIALKNGSWAPFNPETIRLMIGMFDFDHNGTIDFNEFFSLWQYVSDWTNTFRNYDTNNDGTIDINELKQAMTGFGFRLSPHIINVLMRRFDRSNTGRIRFDDFIQLCVVVRMLTGSFQQYDHSRSGNIQVTYEQFLTMVFALKRN